jgi:hypothetical protein
VCGSGLFVCCLLLQRRAGGVAAVHGAVGISDELRRLLGHVGLQLPPVYLRLVAPITDSKALALLPLQVRKGTKSSSKCKLYFCIVYM